MKIIKVDNLNETKTLALRLANLIEVGTLITLSGDLGVGKTAFTKFLGEGLGVTKTINSPTFTILKTYQGKMPLYHMDAYRLEGIKQDLGFDEIYEGDGCCVVEWPDFIQEQLPQDRIAITILRISENEREFQIESIGSKYEKLLEELK